MEEMFNFLTSPFVLLIISIVGTFIARKKFKSYLKLVGLLVEAIEIIDKEIKDILGPEHEKKLTSIKKWIDRKVGKEEKKRLDKILVKKNFKTKEMIK